MYIFEFYALVKWLNVMSPWPVVTVLKMEKLLNIAQIMTRNAFWHSLTTKTLSNDHKDSDLHGIQYLSHSSEEQLKISGEWCDILIAIVVAP